MELTPPLPPRPPRPRLTPRPPLPPRPPQVPEHLPLIIDGLGGFVFECTAHTRQECFDRGIFGLAPPYINSVSSIRPGFALFLYDHSTCLLHGIFEAASNGGINLDPVAWPNHADQSAGSYFPAQVRVRWRFQCPPLPAGMHFRPLITYTDGTNMVRHELTVPEAASIVHAFKIHCQLCCSMDFMRSYINHARRAPAPKPFELSDPFAVSNNGTTPIPIGSNGVAQHQINPFTFQQQQQHHSMISPQNPFDDTGFGAFPAAPIPPATATHHPTTNPFGNTGLL